ncbi:phosphotransferase family protein [Leclercia adecarboxylata]|uniref:phosphotransferase family protein n=1 Tax=Leclercia adecarboxylata TaxID=83655 RepID=UPI0038516964
MSEENLSRMGSAKVTLNRDEEGRRVIEKYPVSEVEFAFYHSAAPRLRQADIVSPALLFADASRRKLRLEYIPHPVDQDAVAGDKVLSMLARLHGFPPDPSWIYHPHGWSSAALEASLALLALPDRAAQQMRCFHQHSEALFRHRGLISGDSNAGNWGRKANGEWVLFDWERFGTGSPAIDLAPLIQGMGSLQAFNALADRYSLIACYPGIRDLAKEIAIAKAWIATEVVLLLHTRQKSDYQTYLNWYREHLPGWLESTVNIL